MWLNVPWVVFGQAEAYIERMYTLVRLGVSVLRPIGPLKAMAIASRVLEMKVLSWPVSASAA